MAAHIVTEFPISEVRTVFTGTSDEDSAYLKIFWKSIHLDPTIESRLVSSDVRQRIPPYAVKSRSLSHGHEKQKFTFREEDPPQLAKYSKNVFKLESEDQHKKRMDLLDKREVELCRHKSRTEKREHIQLASHQKSIKGSDMLPVLPPITSEYNDDLDPMEEEIKEAVEAARDIELFEKQISTRPQRKEPVDEHALVLD